MSHPVKVLVKSFGRGRRMGSETLSSSTSLLEGIGREVAADLAVEGIADVADLVSFPLDELVRSFPSLGPARLLSFVAAARLLAINGMTPDLAELLVDAGYVTAQDVADAGLQTLERVMERAQKERRIREIPTIYELASLQRSAAALRAAGGVAGRVASLDSDTPVVGASVRAGRASTTTNDAGRFLILGLPLGPVDVSIDLADGYVVTTRTEINGGLDIARVDLRVDTAYAPRQLPAVSEDDGLVTATAGQRLVFTQRELSDLPDRTYLVVRGRTREGNTRLLVLNRTKERGRVHIGVVEVTDDALPEGAELNAVVQLDGGNLTLTSLTVDDVAERRLEKFVGTAASADREIIIRPPRRSVR